TCAVNGRAGAPGWGPSAPPRYLCMSDDAKLAAPSFEAMDAGVVVGDAAVSSDAATIVAAPLEYLPITLAPAAAAAPAAPSAATPRIAAVAVTPPNAGPRIAAPTTTAPRIAAPAMTPPSAPPPYGMPLEASERHAATGAAARVPVRRVGRARFRYAPAAPAATVAAPRWRIVRVSDSAVAPVDARVNTWSEYRDTLAALNRGGAQWLMAPAHELAPTQRS